LDQFHSFFLKKRRINPFETSHNKMKQLSFSSADFSHLFPLLISFCLIFFIFWSAFLNSQFRRDFISLFCLKFYAGGQIIGKIFFLKQQKTLIFFCVKNPMQSRNFRNFLWILRFLLFFKIKTSIFVKKNCQKLIFNDFFHKKRGLH
jgi:Ni,Fe-hydrogenase I cytochrome b subunit